jgi:hypothetical protein
MPHAAERLDLVEAARQDIARSKEIAASVAGDLHDYNRWFKNYLLEEQRKREKHARWVKHQQAVLRRREWRHRTARSARRALVVSAFGVRSAVLFVLNAVHSALTLLRDLVVGGALWTARTAQAVALTAYRLIAAGLAWCASKALALGLGLAAAVSAGAASAARAARAVWSTTHDLMASALRSTHATVRTLATACGKAMSAGASRTAGRARALASAASERIATGLAWSGAKARSLAVAGAAAVSTAASWTAGSASSTASSGSAFLGHHLAWLGEKARALAVVGAAAILAAVAAVTAALQAATIATAETLAAIAERLGASGGSLASRLRAQASSWSGAMSSTARDLQPKLRGQAAAVSSSMRRNGLRLRHSTRAKISAAQPMLRDHALRAATLASGFRAWARAGSERLSQSVLKPLEGLVASAPGSLHAPDWSPEPREARPGNGFHPQGSNGGCESEMIGRSKALACIEPWRCRLPAVLPRQGGRQVLVVN